MRAKAVKALKGVYEGQVYECERWEEVDWPVEVVKHFRMVLLPLEDEPKPKRKATRRKRSRATRKASERAVKE